MTESTVQATVPVFRAGTSDAEIEAAAARAERHRKRMVRFWQFTILLVSLGGWELLTRLKILDEFFFSSPTQIAIRLYQWITEGADGVSLWYHLWVTIEEALLGFFSGFIIGVVAGVALGRNRMAADVLSVYIKVFNSVPRVVLAPIFIMLFGLGLTSKVALSFVMVFFVVFSNAFQGVREADRSLIANAQILGASKWQLTRSVIVPSMYAAIIIIMIVALAAEYAVTFIEKRLARWRPEPLQEIA